MTLASELSAAGGSGGSSALPKQIDKHSRSLIRNNQWPLSPAVDTPHRRNAFLRVRANDEDDWGEDLKTTSTIVPRSERKQECSAQFTVAHRWRIDTSWSCNLSRARKALELAVEANIF